ncbi:PREDICTED: lysoplasmalogenase [Condylura cristata]|uniref:lysoplasmalogenase n=1 Tax=Condylura cristata TaxID=143302 RepID=UPI0003344EAA|nr:PREDICTED: lysoplasmalogenase [Condylura cristata]
MDSRRQLGEPGVSLQACRWLSPFGLACALYFLLWIPESQPSCLGALVKCLPVLSLALFLRAQPPGPRSSRLPQGALLCSAVGDACLIWPDAFLYGVGAFAAAHLLYLCHLGFTPRRPHLLLPIGLVAAPYFGLLLLQLTPDMVLPLAGYALLLATLLWRGLARGGLAGCGALLFTFSDCVLAWSTFAWPLPHARLLVMSTYYAAQAVLALSAAHGARPKAS